MRYVLVSTSWVQNVKPKLEIPDGLFNQSAKKIANFLIKKSDNLKQAMSRVTFYTNRAGKNLKDKRKFENVKKLIREYFK